MNSNNNQRSFFRVPDDEVFGALAGQRVELNEWFEEVTADFL